MAVRAAVIVRSCYAQERLEEARGRGVRQCVVLGAGLDTFAWRSHMRVVELDHPATQEWKRVLLAQAGIAIPGNVCLAALDFANELPEAALARAGFDPRHPAFCSCLGVSMYLPQQVLHGLLAWVASLARGSAIAFDYAVRPDVLSAAQRSAAAELARRAAAVGEPWQSAFDPLELDALLQRLGFVAVEDLGPEALNARYLAARSDGLRLRGATRLVHAQCGTACGSVDSEHPEHEE
jgi:methyltransferase (TIGR00027 family)